jgi:hypothetical protein
MFRDENGVNGCWGGFEAMKYAKAFDLLSSNFYELILISGLNGFIGFWLFLGMKSF